MAEADAEAIDQAPATPDSTTAPDTAVELKKEREVDSESDQEASSNACFSQYRMTLLLFIYCFGWVFLATRRRARRVGSAVGRRRAAHRRSARG